MKLIGWHFLSHMRTSGRRRRIYSHRSSCREWMHVLEVEDLFVYLSKEGNSIMDWMMMIIAVWSTIIWVRKTRKWQMIWLSLIHTPSTTLARNTLGYLLCQKTYVNERFAVLSPSNIFQRKHSSIFLLFFLFFFFSSFFSFRFFSSYFFALVVVFLHLLHWKRWKHACAEKSVKITPFFPSFSLSECDDEGWGGRKKRKGMRKWRLNVVRRS